MEKRSSSVTKFYLSFQWCFLFVCLFNDWNRIGMRVGALQTPHYDDEWKSPFKESITTADIATFAFSIPTQQPTSSSLSHGIPSSQYSALYTMYYELNGFHWIWETSSSKTIPWSFSTASSTTNPCLSDWQGITCNQRCSKTNLPCYITELDLANMNVTGTLPMGLFPNLTTLTSLNLGHNQLYGTIPSDLSSLSSLQTLKLNYNVDLGGTLPDFLFINMTQTLQIVDVSQNFFKGTIPSSIYQCVNTTNIDFGKNLFSGVIDENVCRLTLLQKLSLRSNHLRGTIPECIGTQLTNLTNLYLNLNELTGTIPFTLTFLPHLQRLMIANNYLTGTLPKVTVEYGNWSELLQFDAWNNSFTGSIHTELMLLPHLELFDVSVNQLTSTIPNEVSFAYELNSFIVQTNFLSGTVPNMENLTELYVFVVTQNLLNGTISDMPYSSLIVYSAGVNDLDGTIPVFNTSHLSLFYVSNTFVSGNLPHELNEKPIDVIQLLQALAFVDENEYDLSQIEAIVTHFIGDNPEIVEKITEIQNSLSSINNIMIYCAASNTSLTGTIPSWVLSSPLMTYVSLNDNLFTGTIPDFTTPAIVSLILNNNLLTGSVPESVDTLSHIVTFQVSDNQLTGTIPSALLTTSKTLVNLLLQGNGFTGTIPDLAASTTRWRTIRSLLPSTDERDDIEENASSQTFVSALTNFDISGNQISGTIPASLFINFQNLSMFSGSSNCFSGSLPNSICQAPRLSTLSLDGMSSASSCRRQIFSFSKSFVLRHTIKGTIPSCIFTLPHMTSLHLSGNGLSGGLDQSLKNISSSMIDLEISHNFFTKKIPKAILRHPWDTLDISYNKLEGVFTSDMNIPINGTLDAEVNRLSGDIPSNLLDIIDINILNGNVFNCDFQKKNLPSHDPKTKSYECGSDAVNQSLFAWFVVPLLLIGIVFILRTCCASRSTNADATLFQVIWKNKKAWNLALLQDSYAVIGANGVLSLAAVNADTVKSMVSANKDSQGQERLSTMSAIGMGSRSSEWLARSSVASTSNNNRLSTMALVNSSEGSYYSHNDRQSLFRSSQSTIPVSSFRANQRQQQELQAKRLHNPFRDMRRFFERFRQFTAVLTLLVVVVMMPMYVLLSTYERTYENQYAWEFSAAYLTGLISGLLLVVLFCAMLIAMYYLFNIRMRWIFNIFGIVDSHNLANEILQEKTQGMRRTSVLSVVLRRGSRTSTTSDMHDAAMRRSSALDLSMSGSARRKDRVDGESGEQRDDDDRDDSMMMSASMVGANPYTVYNNAGSRRPSSMKLTSTATSLKRPSAVQKQSITAIQKSSSGSPKTSPTTSPSQSPTISEQNRKRPLSMKMAAIVGFGGQSNGNIAGNRSSVARGSVTRQSTASRGSVTGEVDRRGSSLYLHPSNRGSESIRPSLLMPNEVKVATDGLELSKLLITGGINTTLMMTLNVVYVLAVLYVEATSLITLSQITLAVIKLYWNNIAIWQILKKSKKELHKIWKLDRNSFKLITTEDVFAIALMIFFNNIIAPCLSIMVVNPSCFYHTFVPASSVHSTYTYCARYFRFGRKDDVCLDYATGVSSYDPAFFYSYNCASSMPWNYAAVYIYMMLISGVIVPIGQMLGKYVYNHYLDENSRLYKIIDNALPRFWRKLRPLEEFVIRIRLKPKSSKGRSNSKDDDNTRGSNIHDRESSAATSQKDRVSGSTADTYSMSASSSMAASSSSSSPSASFSSSFSFSSAPSLSWISPWFGQKGGFKSDKEEEGLREVEMQPMRAATTTVILEQQGITASSLPSEEVIQQGETKYRIKYPQMLHKGKIIVRLMGFFAILVSFGVIFPPLAAMSCVTIAFWSYFIQIHVGRVLIEARQKQYTHYIVQLYRDCGEMVNLMIPTILPLMFITSMLLGFLVFDTIGDATGHRIATAPAIFVVIFPAVIWLVGKVNWYEVYRRIQEYLNSFIYVIDPETMERIRALQLEQQLEAQAAMEAEEERRWKEEEEEERLRDGEKNIDESEYDNYDSLVRLSSSSMTKRPSFAPVGAYTRTGAIRPSITMPVRPSLASRPLPRVVNGSRVVDEEDDSDSEEEVEVEEDEEKEVKQEDKSNSRGKNEIIMKDDVANPLHSQV